MLHVRNGNNGAFEKALLRNHVIFLGAFAIISVTDFYFWTVQLLPCVCVCVCVCVLFLYYNQQCCQRKHMAGSTIWWVTDPAGQRWGYWSRSQPACGDLEERRVGDQG